VTDPDRVVIAEDYLGEWRWHRLAPDATYLATCAYHYPDYESCRTAAVRVNAAPYRLEIEHDGLPLTGDLDVREEPA
jgi:hypothetical protein